MINEYNSFIIIACDFSTKKELFDFLQKFNNKKLFLKLGMQILYQAGFDLIDQIKNMGHNIFIDLKVHDIPNTARGAVKSLMKYEPDFLTIHAFGGREMIKAAVEVTKNTKTKILVVTVLTSLGQQELGEMNIHVPVKKQVETLIKLAKVSGASHIVSSAQEAPIVKANQMISITPGIRIKNSKHNDQVRVVSPQDAINNGADFIVVGRDLTQSENPLDVYQKIERSIYGEDR